MEDSFTSEQMLEFAKYCNFSKVITKHHLTGWKEYKRKQHIALVKNMFKTK